MLQLALYGAADIVLTGSPQVTFFKQVYRRYTLFSAEAVAQSFQGTADFGRKVTCPISRSGDLVSNVWLQFTLPDLANFRYDTAQAPSASVPAILSARFTSSTAAAVTIIPPTGTPLATYTATLSPANSAGVTQFTSSELRIPITGLSAGTTQYTVTVDGSEPMPIVAIKWCNSVGHALIRSAEIEIGGARIDRHVSEYYDIISEFTLPEEKRAGFETMVGKFPDYDVYDNSFAGARTLFVPLQFFFCRSVGLSLPILALQYHDCKINLDLREYNELIKSDVNVSQLVDARGLPPVLGAELYTSFIYLDVEERRRYVSMPHEMLICQTQFQGDTPIIVDAEDRNLSRKINMNFSHPVKELIWLYNSAASYNSNVAPSQYATLGNDYFNTDLPAPHADEDPIVSARIQFNGHDRISERPSQYFRLVQPYQHHTRIPTKKLYCYSLSLFPEQDQPSGSANFSRLDTAHLCVQLSPNVPTQGRIRVFANSYNVLRIASGLGGLAFAGG